MRIDFRHVIRAVPVMLAAAIAFAAAGAKVAVNADGTASLQ